MQSKSHKNAHLLNKSGGEKLHEQELSPVQLLAENNRSKTSAPDPLLLYVMACQKHGQKKDGVEKAPEDLLEIVPVKHTVLTHEDIDEDEIEKDFRALEGGEVLIRRPKAVAEASKRLFDAIYNGIMERSHRSSAPWKILTIGGDHSIAIGSVSAVSAALQDGLVKSSTFTKCEPILIWVDAHADLHTPDTTLSGSLHGCPVSLLTGIAPDSWIQLHEFDWIRSEQTNRGLSSFILPSKLAYIGLRDVEAAEQDYIDAHSIMEYPMTRIKNNRCIKTIIQSILKRLDPNGEHPIHLSFDIDGIDPKYAPSTGTPVPDGLLAEEGVQIVRLLRDTGRLISMDLVEVNPSIGSASDYSVTRQTAKALIHEFARH